MFNSKKMQSFWQSKYEYYKFIVLFVAIGASVASILYFLSDCYLLGGFTTVTLIPRLAILVPLIIFIIAYRRCNKYSVMISLAYMIAHGVMWCTIWACAYLTDLSFTVEGYVIINYVFMAFGIAAPIHYAIVAHGLLLVDIIIANTFIHYPQFEMMLLLGIPSYLGICIYNIAVEKSFRDQYNLKETMEYNSKHDMLTGAYNRNMFTTLLDENDRFLCRDSLSLIIFDLDFFKKVNDTYGHAVGDEVLKGVSAKVASLLAMDDVFIRWGGEEFIIITRCGLQGARQKAEIIRRKVEMLNLPAPNITVSLGVAEYKGEKYNQVLIDADDALYRAKENGRNRVEIATT